MDLRRESFSGPFFFTIIIIFNKYNSSSPAVLVLLTLVFGSNRSFELNSWSKASLAFCPVSVQEVFLRAPFVRTVIALLICSDWLMNNASGWRWGAVSGLRACVRHLGEQKRKDMG